MAQASSTVQGETGTSSKHRSHAIIVYLLVSPTEADFDVNRALFELQKVRFPADKWQSLANGLMMATAVPTIDADCRNSVGKLQELIRKWVAGSTTSANQLWVMLIDAIKMCDEPAVAQQLATAVGCPPHPTGTTTEHV